MRTWGIVIAMCLGVSTTGSSAEARDPTAFEATAEGATVLTRADLTGLAWALTAACTDGDDLAQRQCKGVRDARARAARATTYLVDGDAGAVTLGAWQPETKSAPVVLRGCVACTEPVGGLYIVGSKAAPTWNGAVAQAAILHERARPFKDEAGATAAAARPLRAQLVVRIAAATGGMWERDGKRGIAVDVLGYRLYDRCTGELISASAGSAPVPADPKACGAAVAAAEGATEAEAAPVAPAPVLPAQLDARDIKAAMRPVVEAARECFDRYGVAGSSRLVYTVGGDGTVLAYELTGFFAQTPTGTCIDKAARAATFPKVQKKKFAFTYPLVLQ